MISTFETYLASLVGLSAHTDPTLATSHSEEILTAAASLGAMPEITSGGVGAAASSLGARVGLSRRALAGAAAQRVRLPNQFILAVVDGIGWKNRQADLRRIYQLGERRQIDGMYTLAMLDSFETDVRQAAQIRGIRG